MVSCAFNPLPSLLKNRSTLAQPDELYVAAPLLVSVSEAFTGDSFPLSAEGIASARCSALVIAERSLGGSLAEPVPETVSARLLSSPTKSAECSPGSSKACGKLYEGAFLPWPPVLFLLC